MPDTNTKPLHLFPGSMLFWEHDNKEYCLRVEQDDPESPREDDINIAHLACWHPRYSLGDADHDFKEPGPFWAWLIKTHVPIDVIISQLKKNASDLDYIPESGDSDEAVFEDYLSCVQNGEYLDTIPKYIKTHIAVSPLYLYDHSGISISCSNESYPFNDKWDSCCCGIAYCLKSEIIRNTDMSKWPGGSWHACAMQIIKDEVRTYDQYLTNDVYGYYLYSREKGKHAPADPSFEDQWEELESCWNFYGSDIHENDMAANIGHGLLQALKDNTCSEGTCKTKTITTEIHIFEKNK